MQPNTIQLLRVHEDNGSAGTVAWTMAPAVITVMVVMVVVVVVVTGGGGGWSSAREHPTASASE
jgi:hypothetical protein